ncbi:MAG: N-acetylmuramoyl-L-alanine amidase [Firmicutes bacterium]|nr:N-acetylmuramoyl-L-alanine amidase [Bacillota bacterium]
MRIFIARFRPPRRAFWVLPVLCLTFFLAVQESRTEPALSPALFGKTVVIDPGHGDWDPGVVGVDGVQEKDVNLAVSKNLCQLLRNSGAVVLCTRENDRLAYDNKQEDMQARAALAKEADLFVSIHANSFPAAPDTCGAQIFYGAGNEEGKKLAQAIQEQCGLLLHSRRTALAHPDAYLLKHTAAPAVIAEMGFLSNPQEAQALAGGDYQRQAAWALYVGIVNYFSESGG